MITVKLGHCYNIRKKKSEQIVDQSEDPRAAFRHFRFQAELTNGSGGLKLD